MAEVCLPCSRSTPWVGLSSPGHPLFPTQSVAGNVPYPETYILGHPQGLQCHSARTGFRKGTVEVSCSATLTFCFLRKHTLTNIWGRSGGGGAEPPPCVSTGPAWPAGAVEHRAPLCAEWQGCDAGMQSHEVRREEKSGEVSGIPCFHSRGEEQGTQL